MMKVMLGCGSYPSGHTEEATVLSACFCHLAISGFSLLFTHSSKYRKFIKRQGATSGFNLKGTF